MRQSAWRLFTEQGVESQLYVIVFVALMFSGMRYVALFPLLLVILIGLLFLMSVTPFERVGGCINDRYLPQLGLVLVFTAFLSWQSLVAYEPSITLTYARRFLFFAPLLFLLPKPEVAAVSIKGAKYYSLIVGVSILVASAMAGRRDGGILGSYHFAGMMMSIAFLMFLLDYYLEGGRPLDIIGAGLAVAGVLVSGKRIAAVVIITGFVLLYLMTRKREGVASTARLVKLGVAAVGAMFVFVAPMRTLFDRLALLGQGESAATSGRNVLWAHAVDIFTSNPVTGIGFGNFEVYLRDNVKLVGIKAFLTHNIYFGLLSETGMIGLGLVVSVMALSLIQSVRVLRRAALLEDGLMFYVMAFSVSMQVWFAIYGFTENGIYAWHEMFFYLTALAMMFSVNMRLDGEPARARAVDVPVARSG